MDDKRQIIYSKAAVKAIKQMDAKLKSRIKNAIEKLPDQGDIKKMQGMDGTFRLRVGQYRIIYTFKDGNAQILLILDIGARGDIYG